MVISMCIPAFFPANPQLTLVERGGKLFSSFVLWPCSSNLWHPLAIPLDHCFFSGRELPLNCKAWPSDPRMQCPQPESKLGTKVGAKNVAVEVGQGFVGPLHLVRVISATKEQAGNSSASAIV